MKRPKQPSSEIRDICARRDGLRCARCGKSLEGVSVSLHHRRLRSHPFDALHEPANLIWLCGSGTTDCHGWVHAHPTEAYRLGYLVHAYELPEDVPIYHKRYGWALLDNDGGVTRLFNRH